MLSILFSQARICHRNTFVFGSIGRAFIERCVPVYCLNIGTLIFWYKNFYFKYMWDGNFFVLECESLKRELWHFKKPTNSN